MLMRADGNIGAKARLERYTFVDYATQGYIALVALLLLVFHGSRLAVWPWLVLAHVAVFGLIHLLIQVAGKYPTNRFIVFLRHFYPILLYTAFYRETELLSQMFHAGYLDEHFLRLEPQLFGMQPGLDLMQRFPSRWLAELLYAAYFSYYLMIGGVGIVLLWPSADGRPRCTFRCSLTLRFTLAGSFAMARRASRCSTR
jgi:hypothetical protein